MILDRLRDRTRTLHQQIEQAVDLENRLESVDAYRCLLARFYGYYVPLEPKLTAVSGYDSIGLDLQPRGKVSWLMEDLRALGYSEEAISQLPRCVDTPAPTTLAQALGCLYVIEGSTLGGQVICREVARRLGISTGDGAMFFAGYGQETGRRWREFCVSCTSFGDMYPDACDEVLAAACRSFSSLNNWIAD